MTLTQARLIVYLLGALAGAMLLVWGTINGDPAAVTTGLGFLGMGGLAGWNTSEPSGADESEEETT